MRLVVHLSGAHPDLPQAELEQAFRADGWRITAIARSPRLLFVDVQGEGDLRRTLDKLALSHDATVHAITAPATDEGLRTAAAAQPLTGGGSFAVRAARPEGEKSPTGAGMRRADVERILGAVWGRSAPVDLRAPERVLRAWLEGDRVHAGELIWERDASAFEVRASRHRPFFSPVSGHPLWMRAIVNVAATGPNDVVYDPLCGTGGVLLEAALAGHRAVGSDLDPGMVEGSRRNLAHFDARAERLFVGDVRDAPEKFLLHTGLPRADALVTDLPFGRSAYTGGVAPDEIARWTMECAATLVKPGGRAVVGVAEPEWVADPPAGLHRLAAYGIRIHRSLTRTYVVFGRD